MMSRALGSDHTSRSLQGIEWMLLMHEALGRLRGDAAALLLPRGMDGAIPQSPEVISRIAGALDEVTQQLVQSGRSAAQVAQLPCVSSSLAERWNALHAFHCQCDEVARELSRSEGVTLRTPWQLSGQLQQRAVFDRVVLLGVLDLTPMNRRIVARLDELGCVVESWIIAPDSQPWNERAFDAYGCVASDPGRLAPEIGQSAIEPAEDSLDQCEAALARFSVMCSDPQCAPQPVVVSCDPELTPLLQSVARRHGRSVHAGSGTPFALTLSGSLLRAVARLHAECTPAALAQLLAQPAMLDALRDQMSEDPRAILDMLREEHLLHSVSDLGQVCRQDGCQVGAKLANALRALGGAGLPAQIGGGIRADASAAECVFALLAWMTRLLRGSLGDPVQAAAHAELKSQAESLARSAFKDRVIPIGTVIALLQRQMDSRQIPVPPDGTEIEAIGWLDALFEPTRHLVLLGMREGTVPSQPQPDGWFTDPIRQALGLPNRAARFHRDAAVLAAVSARALSLAVVGGMVDSSGEPFRSSRLLFPHTAREQAERILQLYGKSEERRVRIPMVDGNSAAFHAVPRPEDFPECEQIEAVSATRCVKYFNDAFSFWLTSQLGLNDPIIFLDVMRPPQFGVLLHRVLRRLAEPAPSDGSEAAWMGVLEEELDNAMTRQFGRSPAPAVALQRTAAIARLRGALRWHLQQAAIGWEIHAAEWPFPDDEQLEVDGQAIAVRGQIDRIDVNRREGRWRVIDYKLGDSAFSSSRAVTRNGWKDPQIPLYVHLLPRSFPDLAQLHLSGHVLSVDATGSPTLVDLVKDAQSARPGVERVEEMIRAMRSGSFGTASDYKPASSLQWGQRDPFSSLLRRVPGGGGADTDGEHGSESDGDTEADGGVE
jgi:hypothetical protein